MTTLPLYPRTHFISREASHFTRHMRSPLDPTRERLLSQREILIKSTPNDLVVCSPASLYIFIFSSRAAPIVIASSLNSLLEREYTAVGVNLSTTNNGPLLLLLLWLLKAARGASALHILILVASCANWFTVSPAHAYQTPGDIKGPLSAVIYAVILFRWCADHMVDWFSCCRALLLALYFLCAVTQ